MFYLPRRDFDDQVVGIIVGYFHVNTVESIKYNKRQPTKPFVPVDQGMITHQ